MCAEATAGGEPGFCHHCGTAYVAPETTTPAGAAASARLCRTCRQSYRADFRFCPLDGTALAPVDVLPRSSGHEADAALVAVAVVRGSASVSEYQFGPGSYVIGRDVNDCAVIARRDPYMNSRHATLIVSESGVTVADEGSENGTFVRCQGAIQLWHGAEVLVGTTVLRVLLSGGLPTAGPDSAG